MKNFSGFMMLIPFCFSAGASAQGTDPRLETVASFGKSMVIGVSVTSGNRLFVSFPNADGEGGLSLAEVKDGKPFAYPDADWNRSGDYSSHFVRVQDLFVDANDVLWVLDSKPGSKGNIFGSGGDESGKFKLVAINTATGQVEKVYTFDDLDKSRSALNDVRIDTKKRMAYFSDPGLAAVVTLDLETGKTRVLLEQTKFTLADDNIVPTYDGRQMRDKNGKPFRSNVNGIALTHDFHYFYFKPINKREIFRIETKYLLDTTLSKASLEEKVETMAAVGITHGLIADKRGNIFLTTSENYSVSYLTPAGEVRTLVRDSRLLWPDSFGIGEDGYLYFSCAQIQRQPAWNEGEDRTEYPFRVFRIPLP